MSAPTPIVSCSNVTKRYGDGPLILSDIAFNAAPGDFISLIGPSGCGKSTLLRLLAGLSEPTSGTLSIDGQPPAKSSTERACVFQDPTLLPWLDVAANVGLPHVLRRTPKQDRAALGAHALNLVGLRDKSCAYPRELSGGQKMRVSLARAFTLSPRLLVLDEPFGALDEITRHRLNEELLAIRERQQWTAFFVTHSVAEAVFLSNRIFVFSANPGRIHAEITVDLPFPRTAALRESAHYLNLVAETSRLLRSIETAAP